MLTYTIFAGVNGVGKTSIYKSIYYKEVINTCDEINIYDNSEMFREIINIENGKIIWKADNVPLWAKIIL